MILLENYMKKEEIDIYKGDIVRMEYYNKYGYYTVMNGVILKCGELQTTFNVESMNLVTNIKNDQIKSIKRLELK